MEDQPVCLSSSIDASLVKAKYPFDDALQDRAVQFLDNLEPEYDEEDRGDRLVIDLVPSSDGSPSRFVESILTLHLSPRSTMVAAALSLLKAVLFSSKPPIRLHLVKSGIVTNVLTPVHSHTPTISGKEPIFHHLQASDLIPVIPVGSDPS
ncbi:hypothetical protein BLNAU_22906 [Blattamonas nauphoetae]|uniref:Uncharacterized protein n=1 Tax=Blattamonas nauphoetae TaxID=2049346 RepID=A0ABQ9WRQ2_9EUKA|nr:hypothetical protein BLNAU_22906 [Blattamonas nauphoetae]